MTARVVKYVFRGDIGDLKAKVSAAGQSVGKLANDLTRADAEGAKFRRGMTTVGDTAGKMGLVAAAGIGATVKAAMDWESAWAGVEKTVNGSAAQMAVLEGELRNLAKTLPASHQEIAAVAEAAGQLGVQREAVAGFTRTMIDLGETTNLSAEEAATSIARFSNIMGTAQGDVDQIGSALVELGNNSATTEAEILTLGTRLAAAGSIAGLSEGDVLGFAAALTSVGVEAEAGGTAMSKVFTAMRDAAIDGGDKLQVFAQTAGMTAQEFTAAWSQDPAQVINAFVSGLGEINAAGESTSQVFSSLGLTDQRLMKALLSAAEAGELLGESLDLGNTGFEENTALAIEAAKRYETTASQVQVAWNNVKDAAIEFGEVALPMLAQGAEMASGFAQAVGSLPGPVKTAGVAMGGITAVLGGGLWFTAKTINGVATMRGALDDLGSTSPKVAAGLRNVGKAASAAGLLLAGFTIADSVSKIGDEGLPGLEALTKQLIDLGNAGAAASLSSEFDSLGESIERLNSTNAIDRLNDALSDKLGFGAGRSLREAKAEIEALDTALANLVSTGNADVAAQALANLAAKGVDVEALEPLLEQYGEALTGVENDAKLAASGQSAFAASVEDTVPPLEAANDALRENIDAMREQRSEAIRAANAAINYQASLDDAREALKENGKTLDITTEKGRANKTALLGVASAWNDQSAAAKNAPGAHRAAIKSFVDLATQMGMPIEKARQLAKRLLELPDKKVKVEADTSDAERGIDLVAQKLASLDGRQARAYVTTVYSQQGYQTRGLVEADGGVVEYYAHGGLRENHVAQIAPAGAMRLWAEPETGGEAYIPLAPSKRSRSLDIWKETGKRLQAFADGGLTGGSVDDRLDLLRLQQQINQLRRDLGADGEDQLKGLARAIAEAELEAAKRDLRQTRRAPFVEKRADLRAQREGLRSIELDVEGGATVAETREALREFRKDVREAGGTWTKQMGATAHRLIDLAKASQRTSNRLDRESEKRDRLADRLDDEIRALEQLQATMAAYSQSVAGNFLSSPFGGSVAAAGGSAGSGPDPALAGTLAALEDARSRLAGVRASGGDPLRRSYEASKVVAEISELESQADKLGRGAEGAGAAIDETVTGLDLLRQTLLEDTRRANEFAESLRALSANGLNSGLFQQLAASGDTGMASALAGLGSGGIADINAMWEQREQAAAQVATYATQQVFGAQLDAATRAVELTEATLARQDATIQRLNNRLEKLGDRVQNGAERGLAKLEPQIGRIEKAIQGQTQQIRALQHSGKKGRN